MIERPLLTDQWHAAAGRVRRSAARGAARGLMTMVEMPVMLAAFDVASVMAWWKKELTDPWNLFGFAAQFVFFMRFFVQWVASERAKRSTIPISFWYLSILGGAMILVYSIAEKNVVFSTAAALSFAIYLRNLALVYRHNAAAAAAAG